VEEVVVDIALLVGIAHVERLREVLAALHERCGIVRTVHRAQITGIVEQRGIGLALVGGLGLCGESQYIGIGGADEVARVEARITHLRAEVADLLQPVLHLRGALGVDLAGFVIGLQRLLDRAVVNRLRLLPGLHLVVQQIGRVVGIHPGVVLHAVHRLLAHGGRIAVRQLEHHRLQADEEALRRSHGSVVVGLAAADPRGGLGALLGVGHGLVALLDLRQERVLVHFLGLHRRNRQKQRGGSRQNRSFHTCLKFSFSVCPNSFHISSAPPETAPRIPGRRLFAGRGATVPPERSPPPGFRPRRSSPPRSPHLPRPRRPARPSPKQWHRLRGG